MSHPSPPLCHTQNKTGKFKKQLTQAKYESKARGEGSDLARLRICPRSRVWKNISFSCKLDSCRDIQKIHFFLFSKLADV